jgi:arylsulfatase A-like enzyme
MLWFAFVMTLLSVPADDPRPNVLLVIADDIGTDRVAAYAEAGDPGHTPVLDALAQQGVLFRNVWSSPVCSPSRVTVLTGRYGYRTGIGISIPFDNTGQTMGLAGPEGVPESEISLGWIARRAGYRTAAIGKWHVANITSGGFDHPVMLGFEQHLGPIGVGGYFDWNKNIADSAGNRQVVVSKYSASENVDDALQVIDSFGDDPWLVWLAFTSAHTPYHVPPLDLLSEETAAEVSVARPSVPALHRAMVEAMDTELGRLLAGIRPSVLAQTLVIFVGDNGTHDDALEQPTINNGAKGSVSEGGINVPLLIAGAGVQQPGREVGDLVNLVDLFSTVHALMDAQPLSHPVDGVSLLPVLTEPGGTPARRWVYSEKFVPNGLSAFKSKQKRALRDTRYKLIRQDKPALSDPWRFYDLLLDPGETNDLVEPGVAAPLNVDQQAAFDYLSGLFATLGP